MAGDTLKPFLDALEDQTHRNFLLATVLEGAEQGSQCLLSGGKCVWQNLPDLTDSGVLSQNFAKLISCTTSGVLELDGVRVFAERFGAGAKLVVCGGGHVATATVQIAKLLDLPVTALEDREEYAEQLRLAGADEVICAPFEEGLAQVPGGEEVYFIVLTRAHAFDLNCLKAVLPKPMAYVGMMGSRGRSALVRRQLVEAGADAAKVEQLHAPIGLAIGAKTAQEIALSIMAQIVEVKSQRQQTEGFPPALLAALRGVQAAETPAVLVTIVARHGSAPREVGSKMLVLPEKSIGSVGGGIMEYRAQQLARQMLSGEAAPCQLVQYSADGKNEDAAIAACGGSMELLLQRL